MSQHVVFFFFLQLGMVSGLRLQGKKERLHAKDHDDTDHDDEPPIDMDDQPPTDSTYKSQTVVEANSVVYQQQPTCGETLDLSNTSEVYVMVDETQGLCMEAKDKTILDACVTDWMPIQLSNGKDPQKIPQIFQGAPGYCSTAFFIDWQCSGCWNGQIKFAQHMGLQPWSNCLIDMYATYYGKRHWQVHHTHELDGDESVMIDVSDSQEMDPYDIGGGKFTAHFAHLAMLQKPETVAMMDRITKMVCPAALKAG